MLGRSRNDCLDLQKDRSIKGSLLKESVKINFKKSLTETWDELDDEEHSDREAEEANHALMALTLSDSEAKSGSGSEYDEEDKVHSNLSCFDIIHDLMSHCQDKERHMKAAKKKLGFLKEELKSSKETVKTLERNLAAKAKKDSKESLNEQDMDL